MKINNSLLYLVANSTVEERANYTEAWQLRMREVCKIIGVVWQSAYVLSY